MEMKQEEKKKLWKELMEKVELLSDQEWGIEDTDGFLYQTYSLETICGRAFYQEEKKKLWKELMEKVELLSDQEWGIEDTDGFLYQTYSLETICGRAFYNSLTEEELLNILKKRAEELGRSPAKKEVFWVLREYIRERFQKWPYALKAATEEELLNILKKRAEELGRSPAKKEVFWVLREYIRERFQKWPYALKAAGLSKAAGKGGKSLSKQQEEAEEYQMFLNEIRKKAKEICRIPHPRDLPQISIQVAKYADSLSKQQEEAEEYQMFLNEIRKKAKEICRIPHPRDLPQISIQVAKYADKWGKVILDAGIDEAFFQECAVYKIKNLETECVEDLSEIRQLSRQLHRAPLMGELPEDLKERVVKRCGSYRNALYQIGLEPVKKRNPFFSAKTGDTEQIEKKGHLTNLQNCYYQVVAPDIQTQKDLEQLYQYWKEHGEMPDRKAVASELRKRLQQSCGSWANALYQIHYRETTGE